MEEILDPSLYEDTDSLFRSPVDALFTPGRNYNTQFSFDAEKTGKTDNKGEEEISPGTVVKPPAVLTLPLPAPATTTSTQTSTPNPPALELDIPQDDGQSFFVPQEPPAGDMADIEFPDLSYIIPQSAIGQLLDPLNNLWDLTKPQTETQTQPQPQFDFSQWQTGNNNNSNTFQFHDTSFQFQQPVPAAPSFQPVFYQQPPQATTTTSYDPITLPALPSPTTPRRSPRHTRHIPQAPRTGSSSIILTHLPPSPPPLTVPKKIDHKRNLKNAEDNRPQDIYKPRPPKTKWGPFRYQDVGVELYPLMYFTSDQLVDFITNREANKRRKLTIWIQNAPAQVNQRYHMGTNSSKCRWSHCPGPRNTILKGFWRVAFDEDSDQTGRKYDPFLNAGYMHLYCFEECFNLGFIIHASRYLGFKVEADVRDFPYESRNPMSITRDHEELLRVYKRFAAREQEKYPVLRDERQLQSLGRQWIKQTAFSPPAKDVKSEERLWRQLTDAHLSREVATRHAARENRGGANIGQHRGDLRLYMRLKKAGGAPIDLEIPEPGAASGQKKRKRGAPNAAEVIVIDDSDEEDNGNERGSGSGSGNGSRPTRRIRWGNVPNPLVIPMQQQHQAVTRGGELDGEYDMDFSGLNPPSAIPRHMLPAQGGPRGKESEIIMDVITSPVRMTRRTSQALQTRLNNQPRFVQKQVLTMIPEHMREIFFDGTGDGNVVDSLFQQQSSTESLEQRLARLPTKVRVEVDEFAKRREKNAREFASL